MIELTPLSPPSLVGVEVEVGGGEVGRGTKAAGRIGPSKMSTHSLTFSVLGVGDALDLISGGEGGGSGTVEVMGSSWACLEMEDEWVRRTNAEELRRMVDRDCSWGGWEDKRMDKDRYIYTAAMCYHPP